MRPLSLVKTGSSPAGHPALIQAVSDMIDQVRSGFEADASELIRLQPKVSHLLREIAQLQEAHIITVADQHMLMDCIEQRDFDARASGACARVSERQVQAEEQAAEEEERQRRKRQRTRSLVARAPKTPHQRRTLSRKLFGNVGRMRTEAKVLGYELRRVPVVTVACARCQRRRIVDSRPSESTLRKFTCGSAIAINPTSKCGQPDEATKGKYAWVWQESAPKLFLR